MVRGEDLVGFLHCDLSGLNRGRSVPASEVEGRMGSGVGWVPADQALTPFGPIAEPNPFGSLGDLRLLPDSSTETRVDL
jgi:glutamine synthetase